MPDQKSAKMNLEQDGRGHIMTEILWNLENKLLPLIHQVMKAEK